MVLVVIRMWIGNGCVSRCNLGGLGLVAVYDSVVCFCVGRDGAE